jgi:hypothetical protein
MGVLDEPGVKDLASVVLPACDKAAADSEVVLSPFAREILADFLTSIVIEGVPAAPESVDCQDLFDQLIKMLPEKIRHARDTYRLSEREGAARLVLTSADVFLWISSFGAAEVADKVCPWH